MHVPLPPAIPELPIWLEEKAPIVFPTLLAINGLKLAVIFGNSQKPRFARMKKPNSVEHDENGIGELLVTSPICAETKQNGSRIALRSRLKG